MKALMIKDLAVTEQLGSAAMSAIHGGGNYNVRNFNYASSGGFASPAMVIAPVTQVDATSTTRNTLMQNFGGFQAKL